METVVQRVFTPGDGVMPPALTGREREEAVLRQCLADLLGGKAPPHNVALTGPRGTGKTALLNWFEGVCHDAGGVDLVRLNPSRMRTEQALVDLLLPPTGIRKLLPRNFGVAGIGKAEWTASATSAQNLTERLTARCRRKPVAVLLDEAHTLERDVGQLLLNASQEVRAYAPFLLVLVGTPGLPGHLGAMNASFWDRLGKGRLGIGCLSVKASSDALETPLDAHGVAIDADALDAVVEDSQRYPYFIQVWGEALWDQHLATGAVQLTATHVAAARPDVAARVVDYYQNRYRELESRELLPAAVATARVFEASATASDGHIDAALATTGADAVTRLGAREELNRLGYIWQPPGQLAPVVWVAGIPSLMTHVLANAPTLGDDDGEE